jgi:long-chain acyl-CoA synthetase
MLILDRIYEHEERGRDQVLLIQPIGAGRVVEYTWGMVLGEARRMAAHLKSLGLKPGSSVAMLAKNSAHFFMVELAVWMAGGTTVAIFPTERAQNVRYVIEHSDARLLFVGKLDTWQEQSAAIPAGLPCIALPLAPDTGFESWESVVGRTEPLGGRPTRDANDIAMLLYTSGSTGEPKGVMHDFGTVTRVSELRVKMNLDLGLIPVDVECRVLSYLPLAHVYERAAIECYTLFEGGGRVYFTESLSSFMEDLKRARPTLFVSVPRLWLKFQQAVFQSIPAATLDALLDDPAARPAVAHRVLASLGFDEVRCAITGSAPVPPEVVAWYRRIGLNLLEGYAMTEDFCYSHVGTPAQSTPGCVGIPCPGVEVRIEDGEILLKSPGCMVGYYKRPELTGACFTADGFFRTGDLGERNPDGQLKITGRVKDLFKTAKGKYVAPVPIENMLNAHPLIEQSIVAGMGQLAPFAVVVLAETLRPRLNDVEVLAQVETQLYELHRDTNEKLAHYERLRMIVVAREPWSVDNGCLTPTLKIKRSSIESLLSTQVEGWYRREGPVLWA